MIIKCNTNIKKSISSQKLSDYEMSKVENLTLENNTNNDNMEENIGIIVEKNHLNKSLEFVGYMYQVFVHVFIFSLFESIFFWLYITKQEDQAIMNQIDDVVLIGDLFCTNMNDDFDFSALYDYQKDKRDDYNQKLPMNNTILLNSYLFGVIVLLNIILKIGKVSIIKLNYKIMKHQSTTFLLLFVYEYLFFRNVIYNYVPNSSNKIVKKIFEKCV